MIAKKLVMLCDYGLDDAIATARILENREKFGSIDIVAVGGNVPTATSLKNARTLLAQYENLQGVRIVNTCAVPQPEETLFDIHGSGGMGGVFEPKKGNVSEILFGDWINDYDGDCLLLSLGPMTITKLLIEKAKPSRFVFMAGCVNAQPNYNGYEFNHGMDPEAFAYCVRFPHEGVLLDTASPVLLLKEVNEGSPVRVALQQAYLKLEWHNGEDAYVWDDIAARFILYPEQFTTKRLTDKWKNNLNCIFYK